MRCDTGHKAARVPRSRPRAYQCQYLRHVWWLLCFALMLTARELFRITRVVVLCNPCAWPQPPSHRGRRPGGSIQYSRLYYSRLSHLGGGLPSPPFCCWRGVMVRFSGTSCSSSRGQRTRGYGLCGTDFAVSGTAGSGNYKVSSKQPLLSYVAPPDQVES